MAPLIRCRNFNPDGTVRQPCRFGTACNWIHPDDPQWDSARNSNTSEVRHHDSRGSWNAQGGREGLNSRRNPSTRGIQQKSSASASSPIDHGWGPPHKQIQGHMDKPGSSSKGPANQSGSVRTASAFPDNSWGSYSSKVTDEKGDTQNGWGGTNNGWSTDANDGKGGKGQGSGSGWGASSSTSGGWGSFGSGTADKGWGFSSDYGGSGGDWGSASKTKTDKATTAWNGWGPKDSSTNEKTDDWDTRTKPSDPRRPPLLTSLPTETHNERSPSLTPQPAISPTIIPSTRKLLLPGDKSSTLTSALRPTTEQGTSDIGTSLKIQTKGIDAEPALSGVPQSARPRETPLTRSRIQLNTIKYTLQAVRLQSELDDARADVERWKRLRSSKQFNRATPLTQSTINDQRLAYGQTEKELETQLHATIRYLADLPELTTCADLVSAEAEERDLVEYTAQLRDWIERLRTLCRPSASSETESAASQTVTERPKNPNEIIWDRIETVVQSVDDSITFIEDVLYAKREIQVDVASRATALRDDSDAKRLTEAKDKAEKLLKEAEEIGSDFEVLVVETAEILGAIHENGLILDNLTTELDECETANRQLASYLQQLEQWKKEDTGRIERLTQQIKNLHTKRSTRIPFDHEDLKEQIKNFTLKKMTEQVHSLFHVIQRAADNGHKVFTSEILKQLDPILEVTNEVCRKAEAITSRLPIP